MLTLEHYLPEWSNISDSYEVMPGSVHGLNVDLFYQSSIELDVTISGANKVIDFYLTNSEEEVVFDVRRILYREQISWRSPSIDSYLLNFDNTMSWTTGKSLTYTLKLYHYNFLFLVIGLILLILGVFQTIREEKVIQHIKNIVKKEPESLDFSM